MIDKNFSQWQSAYKKILNDLLPSFPLTLKGTFFTYLQNSFSSYPDVKRKRGIKPVPYRLVASESHFLDLIEGRRKAIEVRAFRLSKDHG